jgi:hypothetical protein
MCDGFSWIPILWLLFKSVEVCRTLIESLMVSESNEICRSLYMVDLYRAGINCLEAVYVLRLVCLGSHSTVVP